MKSTPEFLAAVFASTLALTLLLLAPFSHGAPPNSGPPPDSPPVNPPVDPATQPIGLVAHFRFNGNLLDVSGNGNHGTFIGGTASYLVRRSPIPLAVIPDPSPEALV